MLPEAALKKAADEMLDYKGTGMSVMEMSHRTKTYESIIEGAEALLRKLMNIPENYTVLFLQGGASQQFAMIPMNLMTKNKKSRPPRSEKVFTTASMPSWTFLIVLAPTP